MYNPKIYIRGYGNPTDSVLVHSAPIEVDLLDAELVRNLIVNAENPFGSGIDGLLVSGDAQVGGNDVLLLSGSSGKLLLSSVSLLHVMFHDVEIVTGRFIEPDHFDVDVVLHDVDLQRRLVVTADVGIIDVNFAPADVLRDLLVAPTSATTTIVFHDVEIVTTSAFLLSGDAQSGLDFLLLSGDAQTTGSDVLLISE